MKTTRRHSGLTLVEVIISMTVLSLTMGGIFAILIQSRRLTEGSVAQNSALTIVQGYLEQMKNMELSSLTGGLDSDGEPVVDTNSFAVPTMLDSSTPDALWTSTGTPPDLASIVPGTTPTGVVDNLRAFDILKDDTDTSSGGSDSGEAATPLVQWTAAWPNARNYPATATVGRTDLKMNFWIWVTDLSGSSGFAQRVFGVTIIYTYQVLDGGKPRYFVGTVRAIRSKVPTL